MKADVPTLERRAPDPLRIGVVIALGFVILLSLVQLYLSAMVIPRFAEIFRDLLGGKPLAPLTTAVISFRWALVGVACVLSFAASFVVLRRASARYLLVILTLLFFQIAFTIIALFLPLIGTISAFGGH